MIHFLSNNKIFVKIFYDWSFLTEKFCVVHCDYLMPSVLLRAKMIEHGAMAENCSVTASWIIRFRLRRPLEGLFLHAIIRRGV